MAVKRTKFFGRTLMELETPVSLAREGRYCLTFSGVREADGVFTALVRYYDRDVVVGHGAGPTVSAAVKDAHASAEYTLGDIEEHIDLLRAACA
jgi:hypothetical protein